MLSQKARQYFKENGYSYEMINRLSDSITSVENGNFISEEEMEKYFKN